MDILFILLGVAIFFAAAAAFTIEHLEINPAQAVVSFFIPPFAWWLYSHYWEKSRRIVYSQLVATALIVGGVLMTIVFKSDEQIVAVESKNLLSDAVKNYVGSDKALNDLASAERKSSMLSGRVAGQDFIFDTSNDSAEFDASGTLRIKQGKGFHGNIELAIGFGKMPEHSGKVWVETIRPDSAAPPFIFLSWLDTEAKTLKSRKFLKGYSMDFKLEHQEYNLFSGHLQLTLPDVDNTYLVGSFPVYSSRLRFHGEGLIKDHDSMETLQVIATQTLTTSYKKHVEQVLGFQNTSFNYTTGTGQGKSEVYVKDKKGNLRKVQLNYFKNESGWFLDINNLKDALLDPALIVARVPSALQAPVFLDQRKIGKTRLLAEVTDSELTALADDNQGKQITQASKPEKQAEASVEASAPRLLVVDVKTQAEQIESLLKPLMNRDVEVQTRAGKLKDGVYVGIYRKQVVLETQMGGGTVESLTEYRDIEKLRVLNTPSARPQVVEFQNSANP